MFGTKSAVERSSSDAHRFELWMPDELVDIHAELASSMQEGLSLLDADPGWFDMLAGRVGFGQGRSLADVVLGGPLGSHLRSMLIATRYGGTEPGSVPPPPQMEMEMRPLTNPNGTVSSVFQRLEVVLPGDSHERDSQRAAHLKSQQARPEFLNTARELALQVLADKERAWAAYVHLRVIGEARRVHEQREAAREAERNRLAIQQCPECLESDPLTIGPIALRALLPGVEHIYEGVPALRSCLACWNTASRVHLVQLAQKRMPSGCTRVEHFEGMKSAR